MIDYRNSPILPRLLTKLIAPRFKKTMLSRDRLIDTLYQSDHVKLVTISAPAGYGKTILLADYANRGFKPCSWLSFDSTDNDATVFIESLVLSIKQVFPDFARHSEFIPGLVEAMRDPENGIEVAIRQIVNEIYTSIKVNFDLILDDYHVVENQALIDRLVNTLLLYLPNNCRVLLSCRTIPSLDLTSLLIQGDVIGLGVRELKMTSAEVFSLLTNIYNLPFSQQEIVELTEKTEGWVTGVILASDRFLRKVDAPEIYVSQTQLFNYLSIKILQNLPDELQTFLLESSVLEILPVDMCCALLEKDNAAGLLLECEHRRLFLNQVDTGLAANGTPASYYRYHNLFRNFLLERLRKTAPERYRYLYRRSAQLFIEQGDIGTALTYLLQSDAYQAAIDLLKQVGEKELQNGRIKTLQNWLDALPETWFWAEPEMVMLKVKLLGSGGNFEEAHSLLNQLEVRLNIQTPSLILSQVQAQIIRGKLYRTQVQYDRAIEVLQVALQKLAYYAELPPDLLNHFEGLLNEPKLEATSRQEPDELSYKKAKAEVFLELGVNLGMNGKLRAALEMLEKAQPIFEELGSKASLARLHQCFSAVYSGLGEITFAKQHLVLSLECWESSGNLTGLVNTLVNLGSIHLSETDYSQAEEVLKKAINTAKEAGYLAGHAYAMAFMGDFFRDTGRFDQAQEFYGQSIQLAESSNEKRLILLVRREIAANLRRLGNYPGAQQALTEAYNQLPDQQRSQGYYLELLHLLEAGIELDQGNYQHARRLLEKGADFFIQKENKREHALMVFLKARLDFGLGRVRASLSNLNEALAIAQEIGNPATILKHESWYAQPFLRFALTNQRKLARFQESIKALLQEPDPNQTNRAGEPSGPMEATSRPAAQPSSQSPAVAPISNPTPFAVLSNIPEKPHQPEFSLEAYSLGKPVVHVGGVVVHDWRTIKAIELLFLLMDQGRPLRKEFIINALWTDVESSKTENLFKTTLYRLRQALFPDWVVRDGSSYILNVPYWYDALEFQKKVRQGDRLLLSDPGNSAKREQALESYQQAAALYKGDFMEGIYSEWCIERQQQLEMLYHELLIKLSQLHYQMGHYEFALHTVEKYLQFDAFSETAHLIRLEVYKQLGNSALLAHSYQLYTQMLKELDQEPSAEAKLLFKS